jgi:predicted metalloendopeptidase
VQAFVDADYRFFREYLQGARARSSRATNAASGGPTTRFGDASGSSYVEKTFGADGKARMKRMIEAHPPRCARGHPGTVGG